MFIPSAASVAFRKASLNVEISNDDGYRRKSGRAKDSGLIRFVFHVDLSITFKGLGVKLILEKIQGRRIPFRAKRRL